MTAWRPFAVALLLPLVITAVLLAATSRNRSDGRAAIVLSEREAFLSPRDDNNTGATISLGWHAPPRQDWLSAARLAQLGFDMRVDPAAPGAADHYARMLPRRAFVAMELDGPALRQVIAQMERSGRWAPPRGPGDDPRTAGPRLVVVDADADADALTRRYPDPRTHLITAATLRVWHAGPPGAPAVHASVSGIEPSRIQVPRTWLGALPRVNDRGRRSPQRFEVELRYGARWEPWISAVRVR